jgi:hypothetical protein
LAPDDDVERTLKAIGRKAVSALLAAVDDPDSREGGVVHVLVAMGAEIEVIQLLKSGEAPVREAAAKALARVEAAAVRDAAIRALRTALQDADSTVRAAARALEQIERPPPSPTPVPVPSTGTPDLIPSISKGRW